MSTLSVFGLGCRTPVRLSGDVDVLAPALEAAWSRCLKPITADEDALETDPVDADLSPAEDDDEHALDRLLQTLTQRVTTSKIRAQAGNLFMVHAGAVANPRTGDAVAFVAPGGTGKTTLTLRLASRFGYLTDETVGVRPNLRIQPYPKPLSLRREDARPKQELSPDACSLVRAPAEPRLRRLVLLSRSTTHDGEPRLETLSEFQAIAALAPETSSLAALPRPLHGLADMLGGLEPTVRLKYRDAETVVDLISSWLGEP